MIMDLFYSIVTFGKRFYHNYFFIFTSSYIFYSLISILFVLFCGLSVFTSFSSTALFSMLFFSILLLSCIHGVHGLIHVLADYTFNLYCKVLFVFVSNIILAKLVFVSISLF